MRLRDRSPNQFRLITFMNSYSEGVSGSDIRFIEIAKRIAWPNSAALVIVTSNLGKKLCRMHDLVATFKITSMESKFGNVFLIYVRRIVVAAFQRFNSSAETVFYATSDFLPDVLPIYLLKLKNKEGKWVQVVHHVQGNPLSRVSKGFFVNLFGFLSQRISFSLIKHRADLTIVVNPVIKKQLVSMGFDERKISVNYNGVDLQKIKHVQYSDIRYDGVFLGRLNISKGVFDLAKIWQNVVKKKPAAKLAIIGKGDDQTEKKLRDCVSSMGLLRNIDFCGHLGDKEVFGILKSSKVFVFPSYEEGFGIAILQAMACGLPAVAYRLPVYREIYNDRLITVPIGRVDLLSNNVVLLLDDPKVSELIGKSGIELAKRYDWGKIAEQEVLLIESVKK